MTKFSLMDMVPSNWKLAWTSKQMGMASCNEFYAQINLHSILYWSLPQWEIYSDI